MLGKNWAMIGDAAAWVDPLTGEGLFYAMKSGHLLGKALAEGCPEKYPAWVKAAFSAELEFAARIVRRFYRGSFLGTAVTTRMVQFMRRSPVFRQLMGDLFSGDAGLHESQAAAMGPAWRYAERLRRQRAEH